MEQQLRSLRAQKSEVKRPRQAPSQGWGGQEGEQGGHGQDGQRSHPPAPAWGACPEAPGSQAPTPGAPNPLSGFKGMWLVPRSLHSPRIPGPALLLPLRNHEGLPTTGLRPIDLPTRGWPPGPLPPQPTWCGWLLTSPGLWSLGTIMAARQPALQPSTVCVPCFSLCHYPRPHCSWSAQGWSSGWLRVSVGPGLPGQPQEGHTPPALHPAQGRPEGQLWARRPRSLQDPRWNCYQHSDSSPCTNQKGSHCWQSHQGGLGYLGPSQMG